MKILEEFAIGIPIALIAMLITFTILYQMDPEFKSSQSSKGKGGIHYCHPEKPFYCKSETERYQCCTPDEFTNQYWSELIKLPTKNSPDFPIVIIIGIGSAIIFNLIIDHFNEKPNSS